MKEYLEMCLHHVDEEIDYTYHAYYDTPSFIIPEDVIFHTKTPVWLQIVFDAFEEICRRL